MIHALVKLAGVSSLVCGLALGCAPYEGDWFAWQDDELVGHNWTYHARIGGGRFQIIKLDVTEGLNAESRWSSGLRGGLGEVQNPDENTWIFEMVDAESWEPVADTWSSAERMSKPFFAVAHFNATEEHLFVSFLGEGMTSVAEGDVWNDRMVRDTENRFPE